MTAYENPSRVRRLGLYVVCFWRSVSPNKEPLKCIENP